jgi:hypothetical protein
MKKELYTLPLLTLMAGCILRVMDYFMASILMKMGAGNEWTTAMGDATFWARLGVSVLLFLLIAGFLRWRFDRKTIVNAASILVGYGALLLLAEQLVGYNTPIHWLYLPLDLFTVLTSIMIKLLPTETMTLVYAIPAVLAPALFILFGKQTATKETAA